MDETARETLPYRRRLNVEITEAQQQTLKTYLEYGVQKQVMQVVVQDLCTLLDEYGYQFVAAILARKVSYGRVIQQFREKYGEEDSAKNPPVTE